MLALAPFLFDPFTWIGTAVGLAAAAIATIYFALRRADRPGRLTYLASIGGVALLCFTLVKGYETLLLARIEAAIDSAPPAEVLTATEKAIEFRSVKYSSRHDLLDALRNATPKPQRLSVSLLSSGYDPSARQAALANAALAEAVAKEAGVHAGSIIEIVSFGSAASWAASK